MQIPANGNSHSKYSDNICLRIYAKVKNNTLKETLKLNPNRIRCSLKLSCIYISAESAGLTFELINAIV